MATVFVLAMGALAAPAAAARGDWSRWRDWWDRDDAPAEPDDENPPDGQTPDEEPPRVDDDCRPLVLNLHGGMMTADLQALVTGLTADDPDLEVVLPQKSGLLVWGRGDVDALTDIVDAHRSECSTPVTAVGLSSGGAMAQHLLDIGVVDRAVVVAGLGCDCGASSPFSGLIATGGVVDGYPGAGGEGVLVAIHGTADDFYGEAEVAFGQWSDQNGGRHRTEFVSHDGGHEWPAFATGVARDVALAP